MTGSPNVRRIALLLLCLLLAACVSRPDLVRLYENASNDSTQPPIIIIHGLAGSTLVDRHTGKQFWPGSLSTLAFGNYATLTQMSSEDREGEGLIPGDLVHGVAGVDFYAALLHSLETVGRYTRGVPGKSVGSERRRYYVLLYDWRKDNLVAVRKLHALIEQIRSDYADPDIAVDIIAHSNGGLIANYYLRYGPRDVLDATDTTGTAQFAPWQEGDRRVRRLVMLGTPGLGAVTSLERLMYGTRLALRTVPVEVMATFATPFQAMPHPLVQAVLDTQGKPVELDLYDEVQWRERQWSVFSPEVMARVRQSMPSPEAGEQALADLQASFGRHLRRAERLQWALTAPFPPSTVEIAVFGGDCEPTPGHAVLLEPEKGGGRLVFRPSQADPGWVPGLRRGAPDFERLMYEPGDGLVTRSSQVSRLPASLARRGATLHLMPIAQTFFLCESHGRLTHNLYFQNNLLFFLLSR